MKKDRVFKERKTDKNKDRLKRHTDILKKVRERDETDKHSRDKNEKGQITKDGKQLE